MILECWFDSFLPTQALTSAKRPISKCCCCNLLHNTWYVTACFYARNAWMRTSLHAFPCSSRSEITYKIKTKMSFLDQSFMFFPMVHLFCVSLILCAENRNDYSLKLCLHSSSMFCI
jgi:hypothetical protein